ncbi:hypothetical protein ACKI10_43405 [Streptomyces galilaeus]|uniref:LamG domain-containing protein n=1 Tax=Streptomyces galilaeus TaxID=33899 RepID=A0ABW9IYJ2_STRGJ
MVSLPPDIWAELRFDGTWNDISPDMRQTSQVTISRGLTAESAAVAEPTACECVLDSRDHAYAPRNPRSRLRGKIGPNTPFRVGYEAGSPWAEMPGTNGNELSTPTSPAYNVTDVDLRVEVALEDWTLQQGIAARYTTAGDNRSWGLYLSGSGPLSFVWSPTGTSATITRLSTVPIAAYNGQRLALRVTLDVDNGAGGYELRFYTGRTVDDREWDLLGDPITGTASTAVFGASSPIEVGDILGLVVAGMTGKVFALKLLSSIGGAAVLAMTTAAAGPGVSSFTSNGAVWTAAGGAVLTNRHIRMAGEVPDWPPTRDLSGNDNVVEINPTGITRRMDAGNKPIDSALRRYIKASGPIECWPLTDGVASRTAKSLITGGRDMVQPPVSGVTAPDWGNGQLAEWIEPVLAARANTTGNLQGDVPYAADAEAFWSIDLFLSGGGTPSSGQFTVADQGVGTDADNQVSIQVIFTGSLDRLTVIRQSQGSESSSSAFLANVDNVGVYDGQPHHIRLSFDPQFVAVNTLWYLYVDGEQVSGGEIAAIVMKPLKRVLLGWGYATIAGVTMTDRSFGYLTYWGSTGPSAADMYEAYMGFQGERAGTRIERLAAESGYVATVAGEEVYQQPMGIQGRRKLLELMNEANRTNFGLLLDRRDAGEVIHRGNSTLWNQPPALTLDFAAGLISAPFKPVDDQSFTENDVSVKREYGAVPARQVLDEGPLSVQDFPDGVSRYDNEYTYSLATDGQADHVAYMRLHLGTYNGVRYTRITLNLANPRVHQMIDEILRLDCGDKLRLTNLPEDHGPDDVDVLVYGYTEDAGPSAWILTLNCVPAAPWTAAVATQAPAAIAEGFEDAILDITITDGGTLPWLRTNTQFHSGAWSLRSGAIANNQTSVASVAVPAGATVLNFWYRTSSEAAGAGFEGDRLTVRVDATQVLRAQGTTPWTLFTVDVTGRAAVVFTYTKDNSASAGEDAVYIDDLRFTIPTPLTTESRADTGGCQLAEALDESETSVDVLTTGLARWVDSGTYPDDFPFDVRTGDEVMRVTACTGTTTSQTFTVIRGINGVRLTHPSGQPISLASPVYVAL